MASLVKGLEKDSRNAQATKQTLKVHEGAAYKLDYIKTMIQVI